MSEEEVLTAIEGGAGGCFVDWSYRFDGPFRSTELKAVTRYMLTWEELGGPPDLPPLPGHATPTPYPTPTSPSAEGPATPTPTPTPAMSDEVRLIVDGSDLAHGAWLYTQNCYRCHLSYAQGRMGQSLSEDAIERAIKQGKDGTSMNAFSRREGGTLKFSEISAIVHYILAWETLEAQPALPEALFVPPTPDPEDFKMIALPTAPVVSGNSENGAKLYQQHCAACHGLYGEGGIGPRLAKVWPSVRPDLTVKSIIAQGVPGSPMPAWDEKLGGILTEEQIDDVVIRILAWERRHAVTGASPAKTSAVGATLLFLGFVISGATVWALGHRP